MNNGKTLILYTTKHGSALEYAKWIHEQIKGSEIHDLVESIENFDLYSLVIVVSPTYMGRITAQGYLESHWDILKEKHPVLLAIGLRPPETEEGKASYMLIPEEIRNGIQYYKVPGRIKFGALKWWERLLLKAMGQKEIDEVDVTKASVIVEHIREIQG